MTQKSQGLINSAGTLTLLLIFVILMCGSVCDNLDFQSLEKYFNVIPINMPIYCNTTLNLQ